MRSVLVIICIVALSNFTLQVYANNLIGSTDQIDAVLYQNELLGEDNPQQVFNDFAFKNDSLLTDYIELLISGTDTVGNNPMLFRANYFLGLFYKYKHFYNDAEHYFLKANEFAGSKQEKFAVIFKLGLINIETARYLEALEYLRQAEQVVILEEDLNLQAILFLKQGFCYTQLEKYEIAENYYNKAYSIIESNSLRKLYGEIFKYRGHLNFKQLNYLNALANYYKGLEFFDQDTIIGNYATLLDYIGQIYYHQENYAKAITYFNDAKMLYNEVNNVRLLAEIEHQLGLAHLKNNEVELAKEYFRSSLTYFNRFSYKKGQVINYLALAGACNHAALTDSAFFYLQKAKAIKDTEVLVTLNENFKFYKEYANYYILQNNTDSAIYYAKKAATIKSNNLLHLIERHILLADAYYLDGRYKSAFNNKTKAYNLRESLHHKINSYEIKVLQSELELSQSKVIIEHLHEERVAQNQTIERSQAQLEKQKLVIYLGVVVLLFVVISAFLLAAFLNQKRRDNKILKARNKQIEQHREEIEQQSIHLQKVNDELEELSIIARETDNGIKIMNAVGRILWVNEGYTKMHGYSLEELQGIESVDLLGEQANIDIQQLVNVWYGDKQPITFESLNKTKDNKDIWVQTTLTPILNEEGKIDKMIAIDSDITPIKQAEKEILIKNQDITSSISYAKRIQEAMMPPFNILTEKFKHSYFFYKPKSIVSGDFYWVTKRHDRMVIACADSTGHGVPGAFMSMIGISFLNKIVNEKGFVSPDIILNRMRMNIINHLRQDGSESLAGDGMDMAVITLDKRNKKLEYAGAMNPVYIVRSGSIIELKPDRMPVGYFDNEDRPFSATSLKIEQGDSIFMFTDGFYDQFGGESGSKMKSHRFKDLLIEASRQEFDHQKQFIVDKFNSWKGDHQQIDDVLLMCINVD